MHPSGDAQNAPPSPFYSGEISFQEKTGKAVCSRPAIPPPFEVAGDRLVVNDDIFYWEDLPKSVQLGFGPNPPLRCIDCGPGA